MYRSKQFKRYSLLHTFDTIHCKNNYLFYYVIITIYYFFILFSEEQ